MKIPVVLSAVVRCLLPTALAMVTYSLVADPTPAAGSGSAGLAAISIVAKFFRSKNAVLTDGGIDSFIDGFEASLSDGASTEAAEDARSRLHTIIGATQPAAPAPTKGSDAPPTSTAASGANHTQAADQPTPTPVPTPTDPTSDGGQKATTGTTTAGAGTPPTAAAAAVSPTPASEVSPTPTPKPLKVLALDRPEKRSSMGIAVEYLRENPDRFDMEPVPKWLGEKYQYIEVPKPTLTPAGAPPPPCDVPEAASTDEDTPNAKTMMCCVKLGQGLVNLGLDADSKYFDRALYTLAELCRKNSNGNVPLQTAKTEKQIINTAIIEFTANRSLADEQTQSIVTDFENSVGFRQGSLVELHQKFENNLTIYIAAANKQTGAAVTKTSQGPVIKVTPTPTAAAVAGDAASPPATAASATTTSSDTDSTTAVTSGTGGSVSQFFQATNINVNNHATLVQEELTSGVMRIFGNGTLGFKIEGSLPVSSSNSSSSSSATSTTGTGTTGSTATSSQPSTPDFVTSELLTYNGGLLNVWFSPIQLAESESPQGTNGRQYESDRYYLSHHIHRVDANGYFVPGEDRYDTNSLLVFLTDGIGMKAYQKTPIASGSSSVPSLGAAGEAYAGLGFDGPTFSGLSAQKTGYISVQGIAGMEVVNRRVLDEQIFANPAAADVQENAQTLFETAEAKVSYVDGSWTLSAFYAVPLDTHTRSIMRDLFGFSFGWNGKSTKQTPSTK